MNTTPWFRVARQILDRRQAHLDGAPVRPLEVSCPRCNAGPLVKCWASFDRHRARPHIERRDNARRMTEWVQR